MSAKRSGPGEKPESVAKEMRRRGNRDDADWKQEFRDSGRDPLPRVLLAWDVPVQWVQ